MVTLPDFMGRRAPDVVDEQRESEDEPTTLQLLASPRTLIVVLGGLMLRLWVINTERGNLLADEAYTGLQAAEVLEGQFRIIIPGLTYTAPFDSYAMSPLVALFGQNQLMIKLYPSIAWGLSAVLVVALARHFMSRRAALMAGSMLWLAPGLLAIIATRNYESYASGMLFVVATALSTTLLLADADDSATGSSPDPWRSGVVGALAGFTFYLHPMYAAVLVPLMCVPAWTFRRSARSWWAPALGGAILANTPFLIWNVANSWPSLAQPAAATDGPLDRLWRFVTGLIPRAYGLRGITGDWVFGFTLSMVVYVGILLLVMVGAWTLWRRSFGRSLIILGPLTVGWILMAGLNNTAFVLDGRYAIITFPFVVIALACGIDRLLPDGRWYAPLALIGWVGILAVPILIAETGTGTGDPNTNVRSVIELLDSKGIDRLSGYYWWVLPVESLSDQRIRTSVTGNPYVVLLPDTQRLVEASPPENVAFLFWINEEDTSRLRMPIDRYERTEIADIVVYTPVE